MTRHEDHSTFLAAHVSDLSHDDLLARIDVYYDTVPRATARAEIHGPLVLFVAEKGWPFYARPRLDGRTEPTTDEIRAVLARQIELGVPQAVEWVHETAPGLARAAQAAGMSVHQCPMLVLESLVEPRPAAGKVRLMDADEAEVGVVSAAIGVGFGTPGTAVADAGVAERDAAVACADPERLAFTRSLIRQGRSVLVGAFVDGIGAVGGGGHNPRGQVSEIAGVGVLAAFRRRGLAGAVAHLLARQALGNGVGTVFCSAESIDVARVYESVGFRRIGTACIAEID